MKMLTLPLNCRRRSGPTFALLAASVIAATGCAPTRREDRTPLALAVRVGADTLPGARLHVERPAPVRVWMSRVDLARDIASPPSAPAPSEPAPDLLEPPTPPALEVREGLKPPLLRSSDPLRVSPAGSKASVELDVHVDEEGDVTDVLWAGGSGDTARVAAATRCALSMRFYPALMAGRPVPVWCRQRFDFGAR